MPAFFKNVLHLIAFLAVLSYSCTNEQQTSEQANRQGTRKTSVEGYVTQPQPVAQYLTATGTFLANESVEISPEVSGTLEKMYFQEGDRVVKGKLLALLDSDPILADIRKLDVDIALAKRESARADTLLQIEAISREEYDRIKNRLLVLQAEREVLGVRFEKTRVKAPFAGIVGLRQVSEGAFLELGDPVVTLRQIDPLKLEFSVPEQYSNSLQVGDTVFFSIPSREGSFTARVYVLDPAINLQTRSRKVRALTENPNNYFFPGGFADVRYSVARADDALMIPSEAVIHDLQGMKVFIAENGQAKEKRVELGIRTDKMVQISSGLQTGDTVMLTGLLSLTDGTPVSVQVVDPINRDAQ